MWRKARLTAGFLLVGALLGGCAGLAPQAYSLRDQPPSDLPPKAELREVRFHAQDEYQCGPAALAMAINAAGVFVTPEELVDQVYLPGRQGSLQIEMLVAARRHGLVAYELAPRLDDVLREVAAGTPVVVLENYGFRIMPKWHYSVVVGYDLQAGEIVRRSGMFPRQTMPFPVFEYVWKDDGYWAMVAVPPGRVPATATEERYAGAVVALEKSGQPAVARTAYEAMLKRWPTSLAGWMGLGNTAYELKDLAGAEAAFRRATDSHPDSVAALNNLAHVLAERGQIDEARAVAERAVALGGPLQNSARATLEEIHRRSNAAVP
ncbi:MAG TPA: PA2778 family cysteine peptidase [Burkholderiales bacterium]|nr:PA2778 family cysteine peptidase [Burkholderiales bacterium]